MDIAQIKILKEKGKTYQEIGDLIGKSRQRVHQLLNPEYLKQYHQRPEYKAYRKAYHQRPEYKAYQKAYHQRRNKLIAIALKEYKQNH